MSPRLTEMRLLEDTHAWNQVCVSDDNDDYNDGHHDEDNGGEYDVDNDVDDDCDLVSIRMMMIFDAGRDASQRHSVSSGAWCHMRRLCTWSRQPADDDGRSSFASAELLQVTHELSDITSSC